MPTEKQKYLDMKWNQPRIIALLIIFENLKTLIYGIT